MDGSVEHSSTSHHDNNNRFVAALRQLSGDTLGQIDAGQSVPLIVY